MNLGLTPNMQLLFTTKREEERQRKGERERERLVNIYYGIAISLILYKSESGRSWYKLRVVYSQE
jgi:hypothetical protein